MSKDIREYRDEIKRDVVSFIDTFTIPELTIILGECFKIQTSKEISMKLKEVHKDVWVSINDNREINKPRKPIKLICEDLEYKPTPAFSDERIVEWRKSRNNDGQ